MLHHLALTTIVLLALLLSACASDPPRQSDGAPPERIKAWMDTLTIPHHYDPETGFIVADRVTVLPDVYVTGDDIESRMRNALRDGRRVFVIATADRCAPCQQYKYDALNDPRVVDRFSQRDTLVLHLEVDRQGEIAESLVGSRGIPMTYEMGNNGPMRTLRGQRSASDLLDFLQ